jgi:hypothetical protein
MLRCAPVSFSLCMLFVFGCGGKPELPKGTVKKAPVSGTVMGGKPLADAEVFFFTDKFTGYGKTNADGKYLLAQGAAIGPNKVYISKMEGGSAAKPPNDPTLALDDPAQTEIANQSLTGTKKKGPKQLIPAEYSDEKTTKLNVDVPEKGVKDADFNL